MVYERGEGVPVGLWGTFGAVAFALGVTAICNLFDHQNGYVYPRGNPGSPCVAAELERFVAFGVFSSRQGATGDWTDPEGEIRWGIATPQGTCERAYREHVVGDPNWVTFYRGGDPL